MSTEKKEQRKAADRDRQKSEILDIARRDFAAKGYEGASMNEIAEGSGFSVGHIYNVIGNKDALFDAVMMREGIELAGLVAASIESRENTSERGRVERLIDTVLEYFDSHREFFQIYLNETGGMRANIERRWARQLVELKKQTDIHVEEMFVRAAAEGLTADLAPTDMAIALSELINGFIAAWAAGGYAGKISDKSDVIKHILWHGIQR